MILKSFGCSFIYGSDLSDCPHGIEQDHPGPSQLSWPAIISQKTGMSYKCQAFPGIGNLRILERLLFELADPTKSLFVISWTWIDRLDYVYKEKFPYEPWAWKSVMPGNETDFAREYYRNYHNQFKDQLATVTYIKQAIDMLQTAGIDFLMTYQDRLILDRTHDHPGLEKLQDAIEPHLFLFDDKTFLEWSIDHGYPISEKFHPLEPAHAAAADYVLKNHCTGLL